MGDQGDYVIFRPWTTPNTGSAGFISFAVRLEWGVDMNLLFNWNCQDFECAGYAKPLLQQWDRHSPGPDPCCDHNLVALGQILPRSSSSHHIRKLRHICPTTIEASGGGPASVGRWEKRPAELKLGAREGVGSVLFKGQCGVVPCRLQEGSGACRGRRSAVAGTHLGGQLLPLTQRFTLTKGLGVGSVQILWQYW